MRQTFSDGRRLLRAISFVETDHFIVETDHWSFYLIMTTNLVVVVVEMMVVWRSRVRVKIPYPPLNPSC